jgi:hypothetical protein
MRSSSAPQPQRSRARWRGLPVVAVAVAALVVGGLVSASSSHASSKTQLACAKRITVVFQVYAAFQNPLPSSDGCWNWYRLVQNTSAFLICKGDGSLTGHGYNGVFDDTNPANDGFTEAYRIQQCAAYAGSPGIYAEFMAPRSAAWCGQHGYASPCWRRNNPGLSFVRYFAELYTPYNVNDRMAAWKATGYGANPTNSYPVINVGVDIANGSSSLFNHVTGACDTVANGGYLALYDGLVSMDAHPGAVATISNALNACT